jgi:two-component system cell cycle sensor histidine kinase/response regulator CckA
MSTAQLNRKIINHIDEGVITLENGAIIHVNSAMEAMTGMQRAELLKLSLPQLLEPPPPINVQMTVENQSAPTGKALVYESSLIMVGGQSCSVAASVHDVHDGEDSIEIIIVRDIAEQKKMQQELQKSRQLESIAALSGGIAHDYNNLLTAIMGNISLALTSIPEDEPMYDWLSQAQEAAMIAKELTSRLITFSKGGVPQKETVNIAGLIESATEFALSGSNIIAEFNIATDLWCADIDRTQIGQAFHNLVINAREAMPDGGTVTVAAGNETFMPDGAVRKDGRYVVVSIKDDGSGIPPEALGKIFDPYFSTKIMGDQRGMGLGLSIANSIIEKHEGKIVVDAPSGEGALFRVFLPASAANCETAVRPEKARLSTKPFGTGKILVMDDEAMIRKLAGNILGKMGFDTAFACNGEEALAAYEAAMTAGQPFDIVILDLTVKGGMGGKDTIRQLRLLDPNVKAIVSSGYSNDPGVIHYTEHGFCGVVAKPYRIDEIRQQLEEILG